MISLHLPNFINSRFMRGKRVMGSMVIPESQLEVHAASRCYKYRLEPLDKTPLPMAQVGLYIIPGKYCCTLSI